MDKQIIAAQRGGSLNDQERLDLARLLIKAGYTVRTVTVKVGQALPRPWSIGPNERRTLYAEG